MPSSSDTIVAPATPSGTSALAVVRVSGPGVDRLGQEIFGSPTLEARHAIHRPFRARDGSIVDDVVATRFVAPHSFTGEDALEISTHGNPLIVQRVLEDLLARGCRMADAGEFTRRAFLHGRMDLTQAEAVMDVIHARSERALIAAQQQLQGALGRHMRTLIDELVDVVARVEAYIDFPEEDLPPEDQQQLTAQVQQVLRGTARLLATQHYGEMLREGVKVVLIGETNVGKSSLLNALLGQDRVLVSPEPGTTRDYVEVMLTLGPHVLRLIDTAGLNPAPGAIEQLGIAKTMERIAEADLFLLVLNANLPTPDLPPLLRQRLRPDNTLVLLNQWDALGEKGAVASAPAGLSPYPTSALNGFGLPEVRAALMAQVDAMQPTVDDQIIAINARHADALSRAESALQTAEQQLHDGTPAELMASHLRVALDALGEIAGRIDHETILDRLFAGFCIGK
jgi:tRNA modification GTPase